jgi:hypothetical protein
MSLVTVSTKRNRVYQRKFDHDECRRLRQDGWTYQALADHYHVSIAAIDRVLNPNRRKRMDERTRDWLTAICDDCGKTCTHNWSSKKGRHDRVCCKQCGDKRRREEHLIARHDEHGNIHCCRCETHKPPDDFRFDKHGFPRNRCRSCETAARRDYHHRHLEQERAWLREYRRRRALADTAT